MFRSLVNWIKQTVVATAFAELSAELESGGAVVVDPPQLTLDVASKPTVAPPAKTPAKKKTAKTK